MSTSVYDVDLLTMALEAVIDGDDLLDEPQFVTRRDGTQTVASYPKSWGYRVARQVLILSGKGPIPVPNGVQDHQISVEERAAELLGLETAEVVFDADATLPDIKRYRDQMAAGEEPDGYDGADDFGYYDDWTRD